MYQNSKIEARCEAVRMAACVKDVTSDNLLEMAKKIENYIVGDIELPDIYDPNANFKELVEKISNRVVDGNEKRTPGVEPNLINTLANA
jgi:hypothetical protein